MTDGIEYDRRHPRMCEACERGDHYNCGLQTWCQCECEGPYGVYWDEWDDPELAPDNESGSDCP